MASYSVYKLAEQAGGRSVLRGGLGNRQWVVSNHVVHHLFSVFFYYCYCYYYSLFLLYPIKLPLLSQHTDFFHPTGCVVLACQLGLNHESPFWSRDPSPHRGSRSAAQGSAGQAQHTAALCVSLALPGWHHAFFKYFTVFSGFCTCLG